MVETTVQRLSGKCGPYQLWKQLPKKMMYQTFRIILAYLEESGKIFVDDTKKIHWTYDPKGIKKVLSRGVKLR